MTHRISRTQRAVPLALLCGLVAVATTGGAAEVRVGGRAFAQDGATHETGSQSNSVILTAPPLGSAAVTYTAGVARADVFAQGDALRGALRMDLNTLVSADRHVIGRNANATGEAAMTGSITLLGSAPAGLATFAAVVEGAYAFNKALTNYLNGASLTFSALVGEGSRDGRLDFDPRTLAGLFSVPLTWTQMVHPGDRIDMSILMRGSVDALVGAVELDVSNTFKFTAIDLPLGYSYLPDGEGFLSQFQPTAVPEPSTGVLMASALGMGLTWARRRSRLVRRTSS